MAVTAKRDPLSVRYDRATAQVLQLAVRAHAQNKGVRTWVHSPAREYANRDAGNRTASERAFTRSAYYLLGYSGGGEHPWSLKLTWGHLEKRGSRYGRLVTVRLYRYGSGKRKIDRGPEVKSWRDSPDGKSTVGEDGQRVLPSAWMRKNRQR